MVVVSVFTACSALKNLLKKASPTLNVQPRDVNLINYDATVLVLLWGTVIVQKKHRGF